MAVAAMVLVCRDVVEYAALVLGLWPIVPGRAQWQELRGAGSACLPAVLPGSWGASEWRGRRVPAGSAAGRAAGGASRMVDTPAGLWRKPHGQNGQNGRETGRLAPYVLPGRRRRPIWAVYPAVRRRLKFLALHPGVHGDPPCWSTGAELDHYSASDGHGVLKVLRPPLPNWYERYPRCYGIPG